MLTLSLLAVIRMCTTSFRCKTQDVLKYLLFIKSQFSSWKGQGNFHFPIKMRCNIIIFLRRIYKISFISHGKLEKQHKKNNDIFFIRSDHIKNFCNQIQRFTFPFEFFKPSSASITGVHLFQY